MTEVHPRIAYGNLLDRVLSLPVKINGEIQHLSIGQIYEKKLIDLALSQGVNINSFDKYGWTLLHFACNNSDVEMAKYLISKGADPNSSCELDTGSRTPRPCWRLIDNTQETLKNFDEFAEIFSETIKSDKDSYNRSVYDHLEYERKIRV